jgi:CheY-like chemotaxis protein
MESYAARAMVDTTRPRRPILLVEDDCDVREAMASLFELDGYRVVTACDGDDALERLQRGLEPCLILLDLMMPRKDGLQFRAELVKYPDLASIPTIAYSGYTDLKGRARALGIETFVPKPVDFDTLLDLVEGHCRQD